MRTAAQAAQAWCDAVNGRYETTETLREAYAVGRITLAQFEVRIEVVLRAMG